MNSAEQLTILRRFAGALAALDPQALRGVCTPDVYWSTPWKGTPGGRIVGWSGITDFQRLLHDRGVQTTLRTVYHGTDSFVALLHDTGEHAGKHLDVTLALHVTLEDGLITSITGHLDDPDAFDNYLS